MPILGSSDLLLKIESSFDDSGVDEAESGLDSFTRSIRKSDGVISGLTGSIFKANLMMEAVKIGASLAGDAIRTAFDIGTGVIQQASDYQQLSISFKTMLGDATKAKTLLKQVSDFAAKTPFNISDVAEGSKQLLAYNVKAEDIIPTFKMLGDLAAGVGKDKLPYLVNAFGQVQAKGHLAGQELLQFTNTGVGLQQQIQKDLGITAAQFDKMMAAGQISAQVVTEAFQHMTGPGGLFFNLMQEQSKTFDGTLSNLRDNFTRLGMDIVGISEDGTIRNGSLFQSLTNAATTLLGWIDRNKAAIEEFGRKILDNVVRIIRDQVVPWVETMGKKFMEYISSPQFKKDMDDWKNKISNIAHFISVAGDVTGRWFDQMEKARQTSKRLLDIITGIGNITPGGFLGSLFRTGKVPGLDSLLSLAHNLHIPGFDEGGYTGQGPANEVAGIVHRGEYVVPKRQVDQSTGLPKAAPSGIEQHNTFNVFNQMDLDLALEKAGYSLFARR